MPAAAFLIQSSVLHRLAVPLSVPLLINSFFLKKGVNLTPGIVVLNDRRLGIGKIHLQFPSPYGIMVLNSTPYRWLRYAIEKAICGADFMFRLFSGFSLKFAFKNPQRPPFHHIGAKWYKTYEICLYYIILLKFFVEYQKYFLTPLLKAWP